MVRAAREELTEAIAYYDAAKDSLGDEFLDEFVHATDRIRSWPEAWPKVSKRSRRCRFSRFPYGVIYEIRNEEILVIAVAHLARRPRYWKDPRTIVEQGTLNWRICNGRSTCIDEVLYGSGFIRLTSSL
jgi:hypothetical protein